MRTHLSAAEVAALAQLLEDAPVRVGVVDEGAGGSRPGPGYDPFASSPPDANPPRDGV